MRSEAERATRLAYFHRRYANDPEFREKHRAHCRDYSARRRKTPEGQKRLRELAREHRARYAPQIRKSERRRRKDEARQITIGYAKHALVADLESHGVQGRRSDIPTEIAEAWVYVIKLHRLFAKKTKKLQHTKEPA